jgi:hypothetical protein
MKHHTGYWKTRLLWCCGTAFADVSLKRLSEVIGTTTLYSEIVQCI